MKYYAFDWDDNLLVMPTKIILKDNFNNEIEMSTKDFSIWRNLIGKKDFLYGGRTIKDYSEKPFRNFRTEGDINFINDSLLAEPGPAWLDFVECINSQSIFAIITARGHNPDVLKNCVYELIKSNKNGINLISTIDNCKIIKYLDKCKFYPISYKEESSTSQPELMKALALEDFINYIENLKQTKKESYLINDISNSFIPTYGFSDDDENNIIFIKKYFINKNIKLTTYLTNKGIKTLY